MTKHAKSKIKNISSILFGLLIFSVSGTAYAQVSTAATNSCQTIYDFETIGDVAAWWPVNDSVMGGRSIGAPYFNSSKLVFKGATNTDGGGFSSIRTNRNRADLHGATAIKIRVKSDNRDYQLSFRTRSREDLNEIAFRAPILFEKTGEWEDVTVDLKSLEASRFGRRVPGVQFDAKDIRSIGFFIFDEKDSPFRLEIDSISICSNWISKESG